MTFLARPNAAVTSTHRIALLIGNSIYDHAPRLINPANDVRAIAAALRRVGFAEVIEKYDLGYQALREELKAFGDKAAGTDWAVVFFAGHGIQVDRTTYLIPSDAKLLRISHINDETIALPHMLLKVQDARQLRLVILDACRNNPFLPRLEQAGGPRVFARGLARIEPQRGVLVAYAARDGQPAEDGIGPHSPFTEALLAHLEEPDLEIGLLFRKVRDAVLERTGQTQEPFVYGSLPSKSFYFKASAK
ncbi:MAG: caspase family protein [Hyphomicrobiaceae bacterium]